jgi:opacity protein-like surface antigen
MASLLLQGRVGHIEIASALLPVPPEAADAGSYDVRLQCTNQTWRGLMRRRLKWALLVAALVFPSQVWAEGFVDLFAGASFTQDSNVKFNLSNDSGSLPEFEGTTSFKTSVLAGGRVGWWADFAGLNLDVSWFRPELDPNNVTASAVVGTTPTTGTLETDLNVVAIGLNVMFRGQFLQNDSVPDGRLQPYVFAGPTLFISTLDAKLTVSTPGTRQIFRDSDTDYSFGVTAGGGVSFMLLKNVGLFAEYRFTHFRPDFELQNGSLGRAKVEGDLNTHHLLAGLTFRF